MQILLIGIVLSVFLSFPFRLRLLSLTVVGMCIVALIGTVLSMLAAPQASPPFEPVQVVEARPVITEFPVQPVQDVGESLNPSELVLGVTVGKQSRAYPINMLTGPSREILNDTLGGQPIAATW
jgi:hypothetical protein